MGCAVPLAMGFRLAAQSGMSGANRPAPDVPAVVAFVGDAGMEMVLGELATLRDLKLPVVIVVFIDESLALIELKQRKSKLQNLGVDFGATDFPAVTRALGGIGHWISSRTNYRLHWMELLNVKHLRYWLVKLVKRFTMDASNWGCQTTEILIFCSIRFADSVS
jgi:thiamine pyrophosphate-dependent acetolactate synthase large subunit-like protein